MSVRVRLNNKVIKGIIVNITKEWRWYHNSTMVHLWVNLLISAREEDGWHGMIEVKKGQVITSLSKLSVETGISIRKIRTCLSNLLKSGEIKEMTNNHYRIITIIDYDMYQKADAVYNKGSHTETKENDKRNNNITTCISKDNMIVCDKLTNKCQTNDKQVSNQEITTDKQVSNIKDYMSTTYDSCSPKIDKLMTSSVKVEEKETKETKENSPHTPYKKKKIKEEENPIFFLTSEYWGARDIFQRISAKAKGLLAKSWSSRTSRTGQTGRTGRTGPISPTCLTKKLIRSHLAAYCSRGCSEASACRKARCSRVSRQ